MPPTAAAPAPPPAAVPTTQTTLILGKIEQLEHKLADLAPRPGLKVTAPGTISLTFNVAQKTRLDAAFQRNISSAEELTTAVERILRIRLDDTEIHLPEMLLHRLQSRQTAAHPTFAAYMQDLIVQVLE